jgi:hypothetical protein
VIASEATILRPTVILVVLYLQFFVASAQPPASAHSSASPEAAPSAAAFEKIRSLEGDWEAPLKGKQEGKVMLNTFRVIGEGSAVVHGEWLDGKQLTTTIFYVVGPELRADHYCDFQNQPRYVVRSSADGSALVFEMRDITNLDTHPRHFHSTTWRFPDTTHLIQDWQIVESGKEPKMVRIEFTRRK